jgi:RNA:NAD 2'-phosphotransferase (TPT1/KptA family)
MSIVAGLNHFNNLLYATKRRAISETLEHKAGRVGMDLRFKGYANIGEVLTTSAAKINGKRADIKYMSNVLHSRPYYGYDAKMDPTILNSIRNRYVDVSGFFIVNKDLPRKIRII